MKTALEEVVQALIDPDTSETGGGHNQKGVEFQKNWAIVKMFALKEQGAVDFLLLFEAIQDVAILDSPESPTKIEIFQVKKKDRNDWSWALLTNLHTPDDPSKKSKGTKKVKPLEGVSGSPVGKLFAALASFKTLSASGRFISNAGCDIKLTVGGNAATSLPVSLSAMPTHFTALLQSALDSVQKDGHAKSDLANVLLEKVDIPVDDPQTYTIGIVHNYLHAVSPSHSGQARSFVESLLAKLGPLGAKTAKATTINEMKSMHGYSFDDLNRALGDLQRTPDFDFHLNEWLNELKPHFGFWEITQIRTAFAAIYTRKLLGSPLPDDKEISDHCDIWLSKNPMSADLHLMCEDGLNDLKITFPTTRKAELQAHFLLKAIERCVDPN